LPADFADQNDGVGVRIIVEKLDGIEKRSADYGIAADADAGGLADSELRQLMDGFVGQGAAAADDADVSLLVDAARHDADLAFAGRDDARAVRPDEPRFLKSTTLATRTMSRAGMPSVMQTVRGQARRRPLLELRQRRTAEARK